MTLVEKNNQLPQVLWKLLHQKFEDHNAEDELKNDTRV